MPKFKISDTVYDIPQEKIEDFLAMASSKGYNVQQIQETESPQVDAGKTQPQVTGAPVEETAAPDTESSSAPISLESQKAQNETNKKVVKTILGNPTLFGPSAALVQTRVGRSLQSFALNTAAGLTDAIDRTVTPIVKAAGEGGPDPVSNLMTFFSLPKEQRDQLIKENGDAVDTKPLRELAEFIDTSNVSYMDEEGNQMRPTDLMQKGEWSKASDLLLQEVVSAAPSLAVTYLLPKLGSAVLGVSTYGNELEKEIEERPNETAAKLYSASALKGFNEFIWEYAGAKGFQAITALKGANAPAKALKDFATKYIKTVSKAFAYNFIEEGSTEAATTISNAWVDELIYGDKQDWVNVGKMAVNDFIVGGLLGGPTAGVVAGVNTASLKKDKSAVYFGAASKEAQQEILKARARAAEAKANLENAPAPLKEEYKQYKEDADKRVKDLESNLNKKFDNLSKDELIAYANALRDAGKFTYTAQSNKTGDKAFKLEQSKKAKEAFKIMEELIGDINFYHAPTEEALTRRIEGSKYISKKLNRMIGYNPKDFTLKQLTAKEIAEQYGEDAAKSDGFFVDDVLIVNSSSGLNPNVVGHEILHAIISKHSKTDDEALAPLINSFKEYLRETEEGTKILERIEDRLKANYTDKNGKLRKNTLEEYLNIFSDIIQNEGIEFSESRAEKIKNEANRLIKGLGINNVVELNTGKDVFNFIRDYTKNVNSKNPFLARAVLNTKIKGDLIAKLDKKPVSEESVNKNTEEFKKSISAKEKQDMMDTYNRLMEGVERTEYSKNNPLPRRLENELVPKFYGYVNTLVNKKFRQVEEEAIEKEDAVAILMAEVANALRTFNPAKNDDISGYVASIIARRQSMIFADVSQEFTDDVTTSKEVQEATVEIDEIQSAEAPQVTKQRLIEAIDIERKVEEKTYSEHVKEALIRNVKLATKLYNEEISANRTVTPFVQNIKAGMAEDLRQVTKKFINEYGYEAFLKDYKKAILQNFTTTYLSKHPLFRKGIEKSIGGKMGKDNQGNAIFEPNWVLPTETTANKYEWVDEAGKKAKIDRDNAGVRGLTSGPEIMRRSSKINSIVTDNEFIDYHFADGALRKKKKQNPEDALAMQIASEIGLEILKDDLYENGPISESFAEIAELKGEVVGKIEFEQVAKDIDRGAVKFSISSNVTASVQEILDKNLTDQLYDAFTNSYDKVEGLTNWFKENLNHTDKNAKDHADVFNNIFELLPAFSTEQATGQLKRYFKEKSFVSEHVWLYEGKQYDTLTEERYERRKGTKGFVKINVLTDAGQRFIDVLLDQVYGGLIEEAEGIDQKIEVITEFIEYGSLTIRDSSNFSAIKSNAELWTHLKPLLEKYNLDKYFDLRIGRGGKSIYLIRENEKPVLVSPLLKFKVGKTTEQIKIAKDSQLRTAYNILANDNQAYLLKLWSKIKANGNARTARNFLYINRNSNSLIRTAAPIKYAHKNLENLENTEFEHMMPVNVISKALMSNYFGIITNEELQSIFDTYYVAMIDKTTNDKLNEAGVKEKLGELYNKIGLSPEATRYAKINWDANDYIEFDTLTGSIKNSITKESKTRFEEMLDATIELFERNSGKAAATDYKNFANLNKIKNVYFHGTEKVLDDSFLTKDLVKEELINNKLQGLYSEMVGFPKFYTKVMGYAESYIDHRVREDGTGTVAAVQIQPKKAKVIKGDAWAVVADAKKTVGDNFENNFERNKAYIEKLKSQGFDAIIFQEGSRSRPDVDKAKVIVSLDPANRSLFGTIEMQTRNNGPVPNSMNIVSDKVKFSISSADRVRLNDMVSETGKVTKAEISEATATRMAKNKGLFRFYIPPSADDFVGLMYYMLRSGKTGEADMQFIKEKLIDPFAQNHAAWESYKLRKLNEFRTFKKLIRNSPTAKLTAKNNAGFTNEDAVRVWLWNKKGTDLGDTITSAEKANLIEIVESNPDLLQFAQSMANLFGGAQNYPDPSGNWFNGSMTIDVIENINEFGRKTFFQTFNDNVEEMFGKLNNQGEISGPIANKLRAAYGNNYVEALSDIIYRMKNGRSREFGKNRLMNQLNNWISNSVGAVMFLNTRSAILQQVSMINFINLSDNNPIKFAQAIANPKQYWSDWLELINSDFLVSRRQGIKIDVNQDEIAKAAESGRNPVQSVISMILKKGFALTTWGDSNAIAMGGATFYRNRINTYLNEGLTEEQAKKKAFEEFKEIAEESQQSSRPDRISQQQASTLGKAILAWANTPMQYARLTKKATLDLINGRGDWKTNMSKIIYYGAVQNLMFTYMQQGLFAMLFDGEDDEEEDAKKWEFTFNSMADGFLRGLGFGGAIVSTAKNMVLEAIEQSKGRGNYDEVVWEALKLSPPLGSKIAKARAVGRTFGWKQEREKVFTEGFSLDNPAFEAAGKGVSALTNIPLDRVIRKLDNISYPVRHEVEFWQAAALYLGWGQWELGLKETNKRNKDKKDIFKEYKFNEKFKDYKFKD